MTLLEQAPRFTRDDAERLAREVFGLEAAASVLPSERDQNFLLQAATGERYVLKLANATESPAFIDAQAEALARLAPLGICPAPVPTAGGPHVAAVASDAGTSHLVRLLTWLPGTPLGRKRTRPLSLFEDLGRRLGDIDTTLDAFDHPALQREFHWDLTQAPRLIREYLPLIEGDEFRRLVEQVSARALAEIEPRAPSLRRSVVHNDANDWNVLVRGGRVTGVIDFGDMVHTWTVAEPAVALAYALLDRQHPPLAIARSLTGGYHASHPLTAVEIATLFPLACLRLCLSAAIAAWQQRQRPDDEYLQVSQEPIRRALPVLAAIPPRLAEASLRLACGLDASEHATRIDAWLRANGAHAAPVLGTPLSESSTIVIDLGVGSLLVSGDPRENVEAALTPRIEDEMVRAGAQVAVGRWNEVRLLYTVDLFAPAEGTPEHPYVEPERRSVHVGLDLFAPPDTAVHAPFAGVVHAFGENAEPGDYGPVIVLRHETDAGDQFFTLYGHLSRRSLDGLRLGRRVGQGQTFAWIGGPDVNGGWTPHLHLQVITDLMDLGLDYPGVCAASEREVWCALSPSPEAFVGVPASRRLPEPPSPDALVAARRARLGRNLSIGYREPVHVVRGWMQYLFDADGRRYLDAYNNVPHVGHSHPRVVEAASRQLGVLNTNTRYLHELLARYAERLTSTLPTALQVCYFVNSGSEANELALRLARAHTGRHDLIVLEGAYHGNTTTLIDISPYKFDGPGGAGRQPWVHVAPLPDLYRGLYTADDARAGERYAQAVGELIAAMRERGVAPAAFIAESCPSTAGQIILPAGYLQAVYREVREAGGVCIADEVQTAYGRIGTHFYGFEQQGVVPDIVVMGKPIGNGYPLGAVVTTAEIAASFDTGMEFFSTFGGSTVSCAVGLAVLDVVQEHDCQLHARRVGDRLLEGLRALAGPVPLVGHVRGSGLFLGVELVRDRRTREPAAEAASNIVNWLRHHGIMIGTDGVSHNVLKIRPPMPFDDDDADRLLAALAAAFEEIGEGITRP